MKRGGERIISAQLRVGDTDLPSYRLADILDKIDAAHKLAGLGRLLFLPSRNPSFNRTVLRHCQKRGIEVYLWYKVLSDNDILPDSNEQCINAFGGTGPGDTGKWGPIFESEESFLFACPSNKKYHNLLLNRCRQQLPDYDGLFIDYVGYPLPSLGVESIFTCFCETCMAQESRLVEWREAILRLREYTESCTDADFERWETIEGQLREDGLYDFYLYRMGLVTGIAHRYRDMARELGKGFGVDVLSPALAFLGGQDFVGLSEGADFLKPRIYCHTFGPSSIPLEYYCLAIGTKAWSKGASVPAIMQFISRSIDLDMPKNFFNLTQAFLSGDAAFSQVGKALAGIRAPVHAGIECSLHPDYETDLDEGRVRTYLEAAKPCAGVVLAWNLLFIPDTFLRLAGEILG